MKGALAQRLTTYIPRPKATELSFTTMLSPRWATQCVAGMSMPPRGVRILMILVHSAQTFEQVSEHEVRQVRSAYGTKRSLAELVIAT